MTTYHDLSGFQRDLLEAIAAVTDAGDTPYELALQDWLEGVYSDAISHSRLYQNLDELTEAGLVERRPVDDRTNRYDLTGTGERILTGYACRLDRLSTHATPAGGKA